jgi:hypothetical protein
MRARTFLVSIVAAVLVGTLANVAWADGKGGGCWYPRPIAPAYHGWYGHPYYYPPYRYYCAPRPVYLPPPGLVYVPTPGAVYGGGYIGSGIWLPGLSLSVSFH